MNPHVHIGKIIVFSGIILVITGIIVINLGKIPLIGKLPGDIAIRGKNWSFYFPVVTCILLSLLLTLVLHLFFRR